MFSLKVVDTDAFLDMPMSSQLLYFHLAMRGDDDGFVANPKKIARMLGAAEDDYRVLITKRFVIPFESGICVIKHWRIHNYLQNDRYNETQYIREKEKLLVDEKTKKYSLILNKEEKCIQKADKMYTQPNLTKLNLTKHSNTKTAKNSEQSSQVNKVMDEFYEINPTLNYGNKTQRKAVEDMIKKWGTDNLIGMIRKYREHMTEKYMPVATTPIAFKNKVGDIKVGIDKINNNPLITNVNL